MKKEFREYLIGLLGAVILTLILDAPFLKALIIYSIVYLLGTLLIAGYKKRNKQIQIFLTMKNSDKTIPN